ncbi:hypothetical protein GCM10007979_34260 [Nocardioides albus]|nr:hypothetical protein GCM10007979_34260 [Nocardioides albus]
MGEVVEDVTPTRWAAAGIQSPFTRRVPTTSRRTASLLDDVLARGRASGELRGDVDAIDVHMLISSYCVFQVANAATFGFLFGRDMLAPDVRDRHRRILGDIVVGWLSA